MNEFVLIAGMALVTFAVRYPVLALVGKVRLPDSALRALRFVPPVVLTAIIVPAVLMPKDNRLDLNYTNSYLVAGLIAAFVAWRTKNLLLTIVLGMLAVWIWRWILGSLV